jgi:adenine-specific DNA-methyltransferase
MPSLEFKGKSFVYTHHLSVPFRELVVDAKKSLPAKGEKPSLDDNLIIHGDNLHALKALLPVYAGKVDCIYIDPPYNTGNEGWCYNDNVRSPLMKEWLKKEANPVDKEDLERHDKWLCMMWPRLHLLRELLSDSGAIFVSIGDEELHRLTCVMDEVFGEAQQLGIFTRLRKKKGSNLAEETRNMTDYVVAYRKGSGTVELHGTAAYAEKAVPLLNRPNPVSTLEFPAGVIEVGVRFPDGPVAAGPKGPEGDLQVDLLDQIKVAKGKIVGAFRLRGRFRWSQATVNQELKAGSEFVVSKDFRINVYRADQESKSKAPPTLLTPEVGVGTNEDGSSELAEIFPEPDAPPFKYPKPTSLVSFFVQAIALKNTNAVILDSFAGSGTTGHAVLKLNEADGGSRRFLMVEMEPYADRLTAERVRRVIKGYAFEGTKREELHREKITWTKLKKAGDLIETAEGIEMMAGKKFDRIKKTVEDGDLVVIGEKDVKQKTEGLGGSFTFATLGPEMSIEALLKNGLPEFDALARYVFYTATGLTLANVPKQNGKTFGYIGETEGHRVHLLYRPAKEWLRSNDAALTEQVVDAIVATNKTGKKTLVFAAAKFMGQRDLTKRGVDFCQLPYAIHRILGD